MSEPRRCPSSVFSIGLAAAVGALALVGGPSRASQASVAMAASLEELARTSLFVARVTPIESTSAWEKGRIVTTSRVRVDEVIAGSIKASGHEIRIRTLGGNVGKIAQRVEGEASFQGPSLVFVGAASEPDTYVVSGRAQGQLVIRRNADGVEVVGVGRVGGLVDPPRPVPLRPVGRRVSDVDGSSVAAAINELRQAWKAGHEK